MKGNPDLLVSLNSLLADELTAVNQYMVHAEICENWGYYKLQKSIEKQAFDEMHHAEWLIHRILFLEGMPIVSKLNKITIGKTVPDMIKNDHEVELTALQSYNEAVALARNIKDQASVDLLSKILKMEESHIDWAEAQEDQIAQMGIQNYLTNQLSKEE